MNKMNLQEFKKQAIMYMILMTFSMEKEAFQ